MDELTRAYLAALTHPAVSSLQLAREVAHFGGIGAAANAAEAGRAPAPRVPVAAHAALARLDLALGDAAAEELTRLGVRALPLEAPEYPAALRAPGVDPPALLYLRGGLPAGARLPYPAVRSVGVVGTRRASAGAQAWTRELARWLGRSGVAVVSGLALGIDTAAHEGAVEVGAATIAVLGSGHARLHPPSNRALADAIAASGGAVVSEYPPGVPAARHTFPRRNRLVSGLARVVVVVEAGARSGALITAGHAAEQGRDVYAVPGRPFDPRAAGTLALLRDGAQWLTEPDDLRAAFPELPPAGAAPPPPGGAHDAAVWRALVELGEAELDELARRSGTPAPRVLAVLTRLELAGRVDRTPGGRYRPRA